MACSTFCCLRRPLSMARPPASWSPTAALSHVSTWQRRVRCVRAGAKRRASAAARRRRGCSPTPRQRRNSADTGRRQPVDVEGGRVDLAQRLQLRLRQDDLRLAQGRRPRPSPRLQFRGLQRLA
eukprot:3267789-Pleurochrysis_carterae.AAC.1